MYYNKKKYIYAYEVTTIEIRVTDYANNGLDKHHGDYIH